VAAVCRTSCSRIAGTPAAFASRANSAESVSGRMGEPSWLTATKPVSGYRSPRARRSLACWTLGPKRGENVGGHRQRPPGPFRLRIAGHGALTRYDHAALGDRDGARIEVHIGPPQSENF
jgi:hypothetical protein